MSHIAAGDVVWQDRITPAKQYFQISSGSGDIRITYCQTIIASEICEGPLTKL